MAMAYVLLTLGWAEFSIPDKLWLLLESPRGVWSNVTIDDLRQRFGLFSQSLGVRHQASLDGTRQVMRPLMQRGEG
jgi:hypothetical protein